jgi:hypothetical protein
VEFGFFTSYQFAGRGACTAAPPLAAGADSETGGSRIDSKANGSCERTNSVGSLTNFFPVFFLEKMVPPFVNLFRSVSRPQVSKEIANDGQLKKECGGK